MVYIGCYDSSVAVRPVSLLPPCLWVTTKSWLALCLLPGAEDKCLALSASVVGGHCPCPDSHSGGLPQIEGCLDAGKKFNKLGSYIVKVKKGFYKQGHIICQILKMYMFFDLESPFKGIHPIDKFAH